MKIFLIFLITLIGAQKSHAGKYIAKATDSKEPLLDMMGMDLEDLLATPIEVWAATRSRQPLDQAPAIVTVITKEEIQRREYKSIGEILKNTTGFYSVSDYMFPNVGTRGIAGGFMGESGTLKVMIDGRSVAFRSTGGNWLGPELIPLSAIERVEIIRGPASSLFGADAFLGVVNIVTIEATEEETGIMQASGSYNSLSNFGHDLDFSTRVKKGSLELSLFGRTYADDYTGLSIPNSSPLPSVPSYNQATLTSRFLKSSSHNVFGKAVYHIGDIASLGVVGYFSQTQKQGEFAPWSQLSHFSDDTGNMYGTTIALHQNFVGFDLELRPAEEFELRYRVTFAHGGPTSKDLIDTGNQYYVIKRDFGFNVLENSLETSFSLIKNLEWVLGGEFIYEWHNLPSSLYLPRDYNSFEDTQVEEQLSLRQGKLDIYNLGAFTQLMWDGFEPYLRMTAGFRYDYHSIYENQFSGRGAVVISPVNILFLKFLYGSAFKAPSSMLLHAAPYEVGDIVGNPSLKPQIVHTFESQALLKPVDFLSFSGVVAYNRLKDKAEFVQRGINRIADNLTELNSLSFEVDTEFKYNDSLGLKLGFEHHRVKRQYDQRTSSYLRYLVGDKNMIYPSNIFRADIYGVLPFAPLRLGAGACVVGKRWSSQMNALENGAMYSLPPYVLVDAAISTVGLKLIENKVTTFSLVGKNLFNSKAADPGYAGIDYPIAPRTVFLQLRQEL